MASHNISGRLNPYLYYILIPLPERTPLHPHNFLKWFCQPVLPFLHHLLSMIYKNTIAFIGHIKGNIFIRLLGGEKQAQPFCTKFSGFLPCFDS